MLPDNFFNRPTLHVARDLLGHLLVHRLNSKIIRAGLIVETEAYLGAEDKASHAYKGKTDRNAPMFGPPGTIYVYLIYGMYYCLNIVTEAKNRPAAVLIRALEPITDTCLNLKSLSLKERQRLSAGPGRLCRWLGINKSFNHLNINSNPKLYLKPKQPITPNRVGTSSRIGVSYAQEDAHKPWRFFIKDNPFVSRSR